MKKFLEGIEIQILEKKQGIVNKNGNKNRKEKEKIIKKQLLIFFDNSYEWHLIFILFLATIFNPSKP